MLLLYDPKIYDLRLVGREFFLLPMAAAGFCDDGWFLSVVLASIQDQRLK